MAGYVEKYADKKSDELEQEIRRVYRQAAKEAREKLDAFVKSYKARNAQMLQMVKEGRLSEQDYKKWLIGQIFQGRQWKQKLKDVTDVYVNADAKAREIVGKTSKNVFTESANYTAYSIEKDLQGSVAFNLYDAKTVERLLKDNPKMLPEWKINEKKDYVWNEKRVQNAVMQGIIQGESIAEIGDRLTSELAASNAAKMNMFARTAVNGAQNAGRVERLHETEEMGIEVKKQWLATLDNRTRDTHQALDGQERPVDEPFEVDGMKIDYPGDPNAPPELVYNCRCTLVYVYPKYQHLQHAQRHDQLNDKNIEDMTYYEWMGLASKNKQADERETEDEGIIKYQYHATTSKAIVGIAEKGLQPNRGHFGKGVYFADSEEDALEWTAETSTGGKTVLRVSEEYLKNGNFEKFSAQETGYDIAESVFEGTIPLEYIQIKVNDNGDEDDWWSLAEYLKNRKSLYAMLSQKTQKKVDKIVDKEFDRRFNRRK